MNVLKQVPDSVLWLFSAGTMIEDNLAVRARIRGVLSRGDWCSPPFCRSEHMLRIGSHLFLDTLLYNAAATSLALQAALPVLTCPGNTFASRVQPVCCTPRGFPNSLRLTWRKTTAHGDRVLGRQPDRLASLVKMNAALPTPLFDVPRFARNLNAPIGQW